MKATQRVYWPGKSTVACDSHTQKLKNLAAMLFGNVDTSELPDGAELDCENCVNEANGGSK